MVEAMETITGRPILQLMATVPVMVIQESVLTITAPVTIVRHLLHVRMLPDSVTMCRFSERSIVRCPLHAGITAAEAPCSAPFSEWRSALLSVCH